MKRREMLSGLAVVAGQAVGLSLLQNSDASSSDIQFLPAGVPMKAIDEISEKSLSAVVMERLSREMNRDMRPDWCEAVSVHQIQNLDRCEYCVISERIGITIATQDFRTEPKKSYSQQLDALKGAEFKFMGHLVQSLKDLAWESVARVGVVEYPDACAAASSLGSTRGYHWFTQGGDHVTKQCFVDFKYRPKISLEIPCCQEVFNGSSDVLLLDIYTYATIAILRDHVHKLAICRHDSGTDTPFSEGAVVSMYGYDC